MAIGNRENSRKSLLFHIFQFTTTLAGFCSAILACRCFTKSQLVYKLYAGYWILHTTLVLMYSLLFEYNHYYFNVGGIMYFLLLITQTFAQLGVLVEGFFMTTKHVLFARTFADFEKRFIREFGTNEGYTKFKREGWILTIICFCIILATLPQTTISWTMYHIRVPKTLLFWHSLPSALTLQLRIFDLMLAITHLNEYAAILRNDLNEMGERNIRRVFGHYLRGLPADKGNIVRVTPQKLQPSEEEDERRLRVFKKFYGDIYNMFKAIGECFGWSLLFFIIMYFIYFVVNSYYVILSIIVQLNESSLVVGNLGFLIIVVTLLWILCWQSQNSHEQSRQIGSIMFKLVKPLGNKSYNDLVTDFSLQTVHQQYVITAKEFFNLNLNLLGAMVASIVTYLVILIQFIFSEKTRIERNLMENNRNITVE